MDSSFTRAAPNVLVISLGTGMLVLSNFFVIPTAISTSDFPILWILNWIIVVVFYSIWVWAWLSAALSDPGRLADDLARRGILRQIQRGDIPKPLRHLSLCPTCNLPRPLLSSHCDLCHACHLRHDHHCGVTGQCVADKTLKPFILSFFWGGVLCFSMLPAPAIRTIDGDSGTITLITLAYAGALGVMMWIFGISFLTDSVAQARPRQFHQKRIRLGRYLATFGKTFWEKILPFQIETTFLAWPGVRWEDDDEDCAFL
jgi:hypothetical protein